MNTLTRWASTTLDGLAHILWAVADELRWGAEKLDTPDDQPPRQYPVGTLWYTADGDAYQLQTNGTWTPVEEDGEPIPAWEKSLSEALADYYEGCYPDDDEAESICLAAGFKPYCIQCGCPHGEGECMR